MKTQKKRSWEKTPLNVITAGRLLEDLSGPEPWRFFQGGEIGWKHLYCRLELNGANDYAEPGYSLEEGQTGILFGNWNNLSKTGYDLLEKSYSLEWSDEWQNCHSCDKAVRRHPDDMSWSPSYILCEHRGCVCKDCLAEDPGEYFSLCSFTEEGKPEEFPSYSILRECGVWESGKELPEGWEVLEDMGAFNGYEDRASHYYLSRGYSKVMLYQSSSYEFKLILGYKEEE